MFDAEITGPLTVLAVDCFWFFALTGEAGLEAAVAASASSITVEVILDDALFH